MHAGVPYCLGCFSLPSYSASSACDVCKCVGGSDPDGGGVAADMRKLN